MRSLPGIFVLTLALASTGAAAETVDVKYIGTVDLDSYSCQGISSSFIQRACFSGSKHLLLLFFNGAYYPYCGVPSSTFANLLNSSSRGKYFHEYIKGKYPC